MRIIAGKNRGRKLDLPDGTLTRPTTDRVRESIFNILSHHPEVSLQGARILDAFAGSGAMGLEALSRGALHVTFVEKQARVASVLRQNIQKLSGSGQTEVIQKDLLTIQAAAQPMDLVFLDPPYGKGLEFTSIPYLYDKGWIDEATLVVYETDAKTDPAPLANIVRILDERLYGTIRVRLLRYDLTEHKGKNHES